MVMLGSLTVCSPSLGSLVVRSVLQPFEESAFTMFSIAASSANKKDGE